MATVEALIHHDLSFTPYEVKWIPSSARMCCVGSTENNNGKIEIYRLQGKRLMLTAERETAVPIRCSTLGASTAGQRNVATGDFDGQVQVWDVNRLEMPLSEFKAHDAIVNCIDGSCQGQREWVTGSRDGCIRVWDARETSQAVVNMKPQPGTQTKDVWAVAFGHPNASDKLVMTGFDNGDIKAFDLRMSQQVWSTKIDQGICSLGNTPQGWLASSTAGLYYFQLDSSATPSKLQSTSDTTIWTARHCPQHPNIIASTSGGGDLTLFKDRDTTPLITKSLTKHPITSFDWCNEKDGLFICSSFDQTIKMGMVQTVA